MTVSRGTDQTQRLQGAGFQSVPYQQSGVLTLGHLPRSVTLLRVHGTRGSQRELPAFPCKANDYPEIEFPFTVLGNEGRIYWPT